MMDALEIIGFISGFAGVYLTIKKNKWCFPVGIINVVLSCLLFYESRLYADSLQQLVYIPLLIAGWLNWKTNTNEDFIVERLNKKEIFIYFLLFLSSGILLGYILKTNSNASFPWIDSLATTASFLAQYLIAKKKIENWFIWIVVNVVYIVLYLQKDLDLYAVLYFVYLLLAIKGFIEWRKSFKLNNG
ncbi:MAG: nicotinamide riboside transporter PnuC [Bacteroidota bacterium]